MTERIDRREFIKRGAIGLGGILAGLKASGREKTVLAQGPEDLPADVLAKIDEVTPDVIKNDPNVNLPNKETMGYWRTREDGRIEIWRTGMTYKNLKPELGWLVPEDVLISKDGKTKVIMELDPEAERFFGNGYSEMRFNDYAKKKVMDWINQNTKKLVGKTTRVEWVQNFGSDMSDPEFVETFITWGSDVGMAFGIYITGTEVHVRVYSPGAAKWTKATTEEQAIEDDNQVMSRAFAFALQAANRTLDMAKSDKIAAKLLPVYTLVAPQSKNYGKIKPTTLFELSGKTTSK